MVPNKKQVGQNLRAFFLRCRNDSLFVFTLRHGRGNSKRNVFSFAAATPVVGESQNSGRIFEDAPDRRFV
jgi:hypothetical protein